MKREDIVFFFVNMFVWVIVFSLLYFFAPVSSSSNDTLDLTTRGVMTASAESSNYSIDIQSIVNDEEIVSEAVDNYTSSADLKFTVLKDTLSGNYVTKEGYIFSFGPNGYFSGFFSSDKPNIAGGTWDIVDVDNVPTLKIISEDGSQIVSYELRMNGDKGYKLRYLPTDFVFELEESK